MFILVDGEEHKDPIRPDGDCKARGGDPPIDPEERYGFAGQLATLTDEQLVDRFNAEVGNNGWVAARCYYLYCLYNELRKRQFDASAIMSKSGLRLSRRVELKNGVLVVTSPLT